MKRMDEATRQNIINLLQSHYQMRPQGGGERYKYGVCPSCGKRKLWAFANDPWTIQCDRESNCGYKASMREIHPEMFTTITERAIKAAPQDPKGIAKAYLSEVRGLNITRVGEFEQASAFNPRLGKHSATVRFALPNGGYWERVIEEIGLPKALFSKGCPYAGYAWHSPEFDPKAQEIWVVEGIFDALALQQNGVHALSAMTCHNFPHVTLEEIYKENPFATLVIALDSNKAGKAGARKMAHKAEEMGFKVRAALTNDGDDWNDKHLKKALSKEDIRQYRYFGALEIAKTASEKAMIMWARNGWNGFIVEHNKRTYWCEMNLEAQRKAEEELTESMLQRTGRGSAEELTKAERQEIREEAFRQSGSVTEIGTCLVNILYAERCMITDETQFYVEIENSKGKAKNTFTGRHFKSASEFGARVIDSLPGANFDGTAKQINTLYNVKASGVHMVNTIDYIGYCPEAGAYIYPHFAVKDGVVYTPNAEDYYTFDGYNIKSTLKVARFNPSLEYKNEWTKDYLTAFGPQGLIVLSYFFGSLFATQIRNDRFKSFPFLEFTGEAGAGKTTVLDFMWMLMGRSNYEGINPVTSTKVARMRTLMQIANMPTVYLEGQGDVPDAKQGGQQWLQEVKQLFNGISPRSRGVQNSGNETSEEPFLGSLIVSQNRKIHGEEAIIGRFIYLHMTREHHTPEGRRAAQRLAMLETEDVSGFLVEAIKREKEVLAHHDAVYDQYHEQIMSLEGVETSRLGDNHATLLAMLDSVCEMLNIPDAMREKTRKYIFKIAQDREKDLAMDCDEIQEFWYLFEYLEESNAQINHAHNFRDLIALNINEMAEVARNRGSNIADPALLRKLLPDNKRYEFIANKTVTSRYTGKSVRCYVFKRGA